MNAVALSVGKVTHIGQVRSRNEDAMDLRQAENDTDPSLFVVADGMGGHSAGNVASKMAVEQTLGRFFESTGDDLSERLRRAIEEANRQIFESSQANADYFRMGTTIVAAAVLGNRADIANVGDSRVYLVRKGQITQVTRDHSWVALQVEMGELTPEEAQHSQNRSVLLRCLGEKGDVLVDMVHVRLWPADIIVLCTDGLHGLVSADEIRGAVTTAEPQQAADDLVALANARGGTDNITVQVIRVDACPPPPSDEGDELVVHRIAHVESPADDAAEASAYEPAPAPVAVQAPRYAPPPMYAPPAGNGAPPPPPPVAPAVPWLLIVLAFLAGGILVAVMYQLKQPNPPQPPAPVPATSGGFSSPLPTVMPSGLPTGLLSSPLPSGLGRPSPSGLGSPLPSPSSPSGFPSTSVNVPLGASPSAGPDGEGDRIAVRHQPIKNLAVAGKALYWLEAATDGPKLALFTLPVQGGEPVRMALTEPSIGVIAAAGDQLFASWGTNIGSIERNRIRGGYHLAPIVADGGEIHLLAASAERLFWVEQKSREIKACARSGGPVQPVRKSTEDILDLVVPPGSATPYWAESGGIFHDKGDKPVVGSRASALAADASHLYWIEESTEAPGERGDMLKVSIHRAGLDGKAPETLASVTGPVHGLAVDEKYVYVVVSQPPDNFSILRLPKTRRTE